MKKSLLIYLNLLFFTFFIPSMVQAEGREAPAVIKDPHDSYTTSSDSCGYCHQVHLGNAVNLMRESTQMETCFMCHDGRGSIYDVRNGQYFNKDIGKFVYNVTGAFNNINGQPVTSMHSIEEENAPPGGSGEKMFLVCTSCHSPHGTSNHRNLRTTVNGRTNVSVEAHFTDSEFSGKEITYYKSGIPNFCTSCHTDYFYYHDWMKADGTSDGSTAYDQTKYRHPMGVMLNGGTRKTEYIDIPVSAKFDPTLFTTLPTEGAPSGAYPNPSSTVTTGGTLATGLYYYIVTAVNEISDNPVATIESHQGHIKTINVPATGKVTLKWDVIANATDYTVYRAGPTATKPTDLISYKRIASSLSPTQRSLFTYEDFGLQPTGGYVNYTGGVITFTDSGLPTGAETPPAINSQSNPAKVICLTCHYAHGTITIDEFSGDSKLKRISNMGVCQNCHKR